METYCGTAMPLISPLLVPSCAPTPHEKTLSPRSAASSGALSATTASWLRKTVPAASTAVTLRRRAASSFTMRSCSAPALSAVK